MLVCLFKEETPFQKYIKAKLWTLLFSTYNGQNKHMNNKEHKIHIYWAKYKD